jgi:hypothetical protein
MPRRVNLQREADLARLATLYLQGKGRVEIGLELRISQPQVSRDLATLQRRWLASSLLDFDAAKARELARIAHLERSKTSHRPGAGAAIAWPGTPTGPFDKAGTVGGI